MASSVAAVAAAEPVDEESGQTGESVAAVAPFHKKKQFQKTGRGGNGAKGGSAAAPPPSPAKLRGWHLDCAGTTGSSERRPASA
jgi:hypothetical protein